MAHYECQTCHMEATVVVTPSAELAWLDHMETHAVKDHYRMWTWSVVELPI